MAGEDVGHVEDPSALKALAHPLRLRLLAAVREIGPATSAELAKRLGTDPGSTGYHLRILARHGYVTDAPADASDGRRGRRRLWAAVHQLTSWSNTAFATTPAGREALALMRRRQVEVLINDVSRFDEALSDLDPAWVEVAGIGDLLVRLTPASVTKLWDGFYALLDELVDQDDLDPTARQVSVVVAAFPREEES